MRQINRMMSAAARLRQKGSALLVALMTLVGLSLLGLAFVAMSETESAISVNQRNHAQVVATSESAAREVVQWFQNPTAALANGGGTIRMMPDQSTAVATWAKTQRVVQAYTGYYKDSTSKNLCDLPYGPDNDDLLFGNEASADIVIDRTTSQGRDFLDNNFNAGLLGTGNDPRDTGEVTSIRIFAPPILGGALIADPGGSGHSFWVNGTRLGVATIAVRVDKYDNSDATRRSIATATCRIVVGQFPLPTPAGPLQSQTALQTQGNFNVNWGIVASGSTLQLAKDYQTLPWVNAYELIHFERGYDSSIEWSSGQTYYQYDIIRPTVAARSANSLLRAHEYTVTTSGGGGCTSGSSEPSWTTTLGGSVNANGGGTCQFQERFPTAYPIDASLPNQQDSLHPWLYYVATGTFNVQDPWFQARAVGAISGDTAGLPQPYPFPYLASIPITYGNTHHFQNQSFNSYPSYRQVVFPTMDYNFWKATAIAANGVGGVHYVWPAGNVAGNTYTDGVNSGNLAYWTGTGNGFTFFDTVNQQNPQNSGPGVLNSNQDPGSSGYVEGFVYLNAPWNGRGQANGPIGWFNQPGEPYEDVGFRQVAESTTATQVGGNFVTDVSGQPIIIDAYNNKWDFQDLAWSNSGGVCCSGTKDGTFNVFVRQHHVTNPGTNTAYDGYFVVPYYPGCHPGDNATLGNDALGCSEPHEPYLNVIYVGGHEPNQDNSNVLYLNIGWQNPSSQTRVAKKTNDGTPLGTPLTCTSTSSTDDCTSNAYDKRGGLVELDPGPMTTGVLYCEGLFGTTGNGVYYGAVLAGSGGIDPKGTPHVWYDQSLQDGSWLPPGLPRVLITSLQMDQN